MDLRETSGARGWARIAAAVAAIGALGVAGTASFTTHYTVRRGDTLGAIAGRAGVSLADLTALNHLSDPNRIFAGQVIDIGRRPAVATTARVPVAPTARNGATAYPVVLRRHPERLALLPSFRRWAATSRVPADLLEAMCWMESGWQNKVVSPSGAVGIGQLEPSTARFVSHDLIGVRLDPHRPDDNIRMSAAYLRWLLDHSHAGVSGALAAYYQGIGSVARRGALPETRRYVTVIELLRPAFA